MNSLRFIFNLLVAFTLLSFNAAAQRPAADLIATGKLANLVILSDDIFSIEKRAIKDVRVLKTIVGGKVVYSSK